MSECVWLTSVGRTRSRRSRMISFWDGFERLKVGIDLSGVGDTVSILNSITVTYANYNLIVCK